MAGQTNVPCVKCCFPVPLGMNFCTKCGASQAARVKKKIVPLIMGWTRDGRLDGIYDEEGQQYLSKTMLEVERSRGVQIGVVSVAGDPLQQGASKVDIKDSVVQRTQLGSGATKPKCCPHCGQPIDMPGTPRFCPQCGGKPA